MSNKHKFDASFMTMMWKLVRGTDIGEAWLKEWKDLTKTSQENALSFYFIFSIVESYL